MDYIKNMKPDDQNFWDNVVKTITCWNWVGPKDCEGYGLYTTKGKQVRVHRYIYELNQSVIPKSYFVRHTCDKPDCINLDHLRLGSAQQNSRDMVDRNRSNRNKQIRHLSSTEKVQIRQLYNTTEITASELAERFKVCRRTVTRILTKKVFEKGQSEIKQQILSTLNELQRLIEEL